MIGSVSIATRSLNIKGVSVVHSIEGASTGLGVGGSNASVKGWPTSVGG